MPPVWESFTGLWPARGENILERPHRRTALLEVPETLAPADTEMLKRLAIIILEAPVKVRSSRIATGNSFDIGAWIADKGLVISKEKIINGGTLYELEECQFNHEHRRTAYIIGMDSGAITAGCHHASCQDKKWPDLRDLLEPDWRDSDRNDEVSLLDSNTSRSPYRVENGCIALIKQGNDGPITVQLSNFQARIVSETVHDNGAESKAYFFIEGVLYNGEILPGIEVPASSFAAMSWVPTNWGSRAIITAGFANRDHLRAAIQSVSVEGLRRMVVYTHWLAKDR